jgi:hypothetical protein
MTPWRFLRRWLIARAIRRLLREGAKDDLKTAAAPVLTLWSELWTTHVPHVPHVVTAPRPPKAKPGPGRQAIAMPSNVTPYGGPPWAGLIPPEAHYAAYEDCHTYAKGARPVRDDFGYHGEPALSFICPGCELEQPPILTGTRVCGYCGLRTLLHGSRLIWWRKAVEVAEWKPAPILKPTRDPSP